MTNTRFIPDLAEDERYIGGIVAADGTTTHIILLPGTFQGTWKKSMNWAAKQGGDLPNRVEEALMYATAKEEFEPSWYWSNTESASGYAWYQYFTSGHQYYHHKDYELRARAVRRLVI
jgi:hypothetical protein